MLKNLLTAVLLDNIGIGIFADWYSPTVSVALSQHVAVGDRFMGIRLLGALRLSARPVNKLAPRGLSGLAWDEDDKVLYAISDKGELY